VAKCRTCRARRNETFKLGAVALLEKRADGSSWRPDVTVTTGEGVKWALEVYHTHMSEEDRNSELRNMQYNIAEFKAVDVIAAEERLVCCTEGH
jgi:hypothetical protein